MHRHTGWLCLLFGIAVLMTGCTTEPLDRSGISGSITVPNTNPAAIRSAALPAFARYGYSPGRGSTAQSLAFQRPSSQFGARLLDTPATTTNLGVRLQLLPLPHNNDFRLLVQVNRIDIRQPAGTAADTKSVRLWMSQFESILREIRANAANAGAVR